MRLTRLASLSLAAPALAAAAILVAPAAPVTAPIETAAAAQASPEAKTPAATKKAKARSKARAKIRAKARSKARAKVGAKKWKQLNSKKRARLTSKSLFRMKARSKARARAGARRWAKMNTRQRNRATTKVILQIRAKARARANKKRNGVSTGITAPRKQKNVARKSTAPVVPTTAWAAQPGLEEATFIEINRVRRSRGLNALKSSTILKRPARSHSKWLATARNGNLTHNDAKGRPFHVRIVAAGWAANRRMSENLASINACRAQDPKLMVKNWLASPGHRINLLDPKVTHVGVGVISTRNCGSTVYTTDFAA